MVDQTKIRHEWYQTETELVLSVFIRNTIPEHVNLRFSPRSVSLTYQSPNTPSSETSFNLEPLTHEINPDLSSWKSLSSKIEIRLKKKVEGVTWIKIEGEEESNIPVAPVVAQDTKTSENARQSAYPSSSRRKTNWDKLAESVEKEEEEAIKNLKDPNAGGDRALNQLFQKLYADATDEQKKAMMKSYVESNGTALSTDWSDVSKKKVETRPPESMVARPWKA